MEGGRIVSLYEIVFTISMLLLIIFVSKVSYLQGRDDEYEEYIEYQQDIIECEPRNIKPIMTFGEWKNERE